MLTFYPEKSSSVIKEGLQRRSFLGVLHTGLLLLVCLRGENKRGYCGGSGSAANTVSLERR